MISRRIVTEQRIGIEGNYKGIVENRLDVVKKDLIENFA